MSPQRMTTLSSRRAIAWGRTIRHCHTVSSSLIHSTIISGTFLSSKLSGSLGVVYVVLLAVHLNAGTCLVISMAVSILFMLTRRACIRHRNVTSSWHSISHRCSISLIRISVVHLLTILRSVIFCVYNFLLLVMSMMPLRALVMSFWRLLVIFGC